MIRDGAEEGWRYRLLAFLRRDRAHLRCESSRHRISIMAASSLTSANSAGSAPVIHTWHRAGEVRRAERRAGRGRGARPLRPAGGLAWKPSFRRSTLLRQNEADQQRFLLAGRSLAGGDILAHVDDRKIGEMRTIEGAPGGGVDAVCCRGAPTDSAPRLRLPDGWGSTAPSSLQAKSRPAGSRSHGGSPARVPADAGPRREARPPRRRARRFHVRRRPANAGRGAPRPVTGCAERNARSRALTRLACSASTASARRSRKRRRSDGAPTNRESIDGTSQTTLR